MIPRRVALQRVTVALGGAVVLDASGRQVALMALLQSGPGMDGSLAFVCDLANGLTVRVDVLPAPSLLERLRRWLGAS